MESTDGDEHELRAHIRSLLLEYALQHLAVNYVAWTQASVEELLSECLTFVPLTEPTLVTFPVDPLVLLSRQWNLAQLDIYGEVWQVQSPEALHYLRRQLHRASSRKRTADQVWEDDTDNEYNAFLLERPLSPILTTRARQETQQLGKRIHAGQMPQSAAKLVSACEIKHAIEETVDEQRISVDDALGNKLVMDLETHRDVLALVNSIPTMSSSVRVPSASRPWDDILRADSPPIEIPEFETLPLFPRDLRPGARARPMETETVFAKSLSLVAEQPESWLRPVSVKEEDEEDLAAENLVLVDGWHAYQTPSSPLTAGTPSLADTSSDVDDLFLPSSSMPLLDELMPMEEYQIPRSEKMGYSDSTRPVQGLESNLSQFLSPLLHPSQTGAPRIVHSPTSRPSSPHTEITASVLGQPPSVLDDPAPPSRERPDNNLYSDDSITAATKAVEQACGCLLPGEDVASIILEEKLDEKDSMLMEVPSLRPPNEHPPGDLLLPMTFAELLVQSSSKGSAAITSRVESAAGYLKKVKGVQPLQIELSWIPFKYGPTIPTDEEVADVANDPCPQMAKEIDLVQDEVVSKLSVLLDDSQAFSPQPPNKSAEPSTLSWYDDEEWNALRVDTAYTVVDVSLILARGDRRRLAGLPALSEAESEEDIGSSDKENEPHASVTPCGLELPTKRVRFNEDERDAEEAKVKDSMHPVATHERRDSGVFFVDNTTAIEIDSMEQNTFTQLAYDAEGFDGPLGDGDVFPDTHPVHEGDYRFDLSPHRDLEHFPRTSCSTLDCRSFSNDNLYDILVTEAPLLPCQEPRVLDSCYIQAVTQEEEDTTVVASQALNTSHLSGNTPTWNAEHEPASTDRLSRPPGVFSARLSLAQFLTFCGKSSLADSTTNLTESVPSCPASETVPAHQTILSLTSRDTPEELLDERTIVLSDPFEPPGHTHRYIASMDLIQKRALVRTLTAYGAVEVVERERLGQNETDVHLILDCETAVLFYTLEVLPSGGDALANLLTRLSWRYAHILVVFECYPSSWDYRGDRNFTGKPVASSWSPPVVKAVKKLRRDLSIAEGIQAKRAKTVVDYAFANTVEEAAAHARAYGDTAEMNDVTQGQAWGDRAWLTHEERDGEYDLCGVEGMNVFAASLLLTYMNLEDFLEKSAEERFLECGDLVGGERIAQFNVEMARRLDAMQLPPSSPINADTLSSLDTVPCLRDSEMDLTF